MTATDQISETHQCLCCERPIKTGDLCERCECESTAERCERHGLLVFEWGLCEECEAALEAEFAAREAAEEQERLAKKWNIVSADEVSNVVRKTRNRADLVQGLIGQGSFNLLVGDSDLGKSPLLYQLALWVATGKPFLDLPVKQGDVPVVDFENSYEDIDALLDSLCRFLGLAERPRELQIFSLYGAPERYGQTDYRARDLIRDMQTPCRKLTIVDTLRAYDANIVERNADAANAIQFFREMSRISNSAFIGSHHLRKPSSDLKLQPIALQMPSTNLVNGSTRLAERCR